jgi:hypothetical protein
MLNLFAATDPYWGGFWPRARRAGSREPIPCAICGLVVGLETSEYLIETFSAEASFRMGDVDRNTSVTIFLCLEVVVKLNLESSVFSFQRIVDIHILLAGLVVHSSPESSAFFSSVLVAAGTKTCGFSIARRLARRSSRSIKS